MNKSIFHDLCKLIFPKGGPTPNIITSLWCSCMAWLVCGFPSKREEVFQELSVSINEIKSVLDIDEIRAHTASGYRHIERQWIQYLMQDLNSCIQPSYIYHRLCFLEYSHSWSSIRSAVHFSYLRLLSSCICCRFCSSASSRIFQHLCHLFCKREERVTTFGGDHTGLGACVWINPHISLHLRYFLVVHLRDLSPVPLQTDEPPSSHRKGQDFLSLNFPFFLFPFPSSSLFKPRERASSLAHVELWCMQILLVLPWPFFFPLLSF